MRLVAAITLAMSVSLAAMFVAQAQDKASTSGAAPAGAATSAKKCTNPDAIGLARTVQIDTTGGPGFGFEHFKAYDFLRNNEVVLTFDDGPWPGNTQSVLAALAEQCVKATFFPIGKHAMWYPNILKEVAAAGHTIGSHTWSHVDLSRKKTTEESIDEIEKGFSAVHSAVGADTAPLFRFPALKHPPELVEYLGKRNVGIFSTDMDSFDFKMRKPEQVIASVLAKLKKHGKGIVLMHDFQSHTSQAVPELLKQLKANGYKIVHVTTKDQVKTEAKYDEAILKEFGGNTIGARPVSSVVRTVEEAK
ncbi:MAG: polysaccharide deacetylase family protein [Rhizobiales bacterium]|nr:polysaccharide deacetylase family protein [Hyphomicrobiales bacterium]